MPGVSKYVRDPAVKCPYYRKESAIEIKCLGLCGGHTVNVFANGNEKKDYKEDFCKGFSWNCPLYIALDIDNGDME